MCRNLCDVQKGRGVISGAGECIAKHRIAEWAGSADGRGSGGDEFLGANVADALASFFAQKRDAAARSAAEAALAVAWGFDEFACGGDDGAWLVVDIPVATEVAGVVVDDSFRSLRG